MTIEPEDVNDDELREAPPEDQAEAMKDWFLARYEDPVHHLLYDSEEGGYFWIGGPHDATEVLSERFGDIVPHDVIEEAAGDLNDECAEWVSKSELDEAYEDYTDSPLTTLQGALRKTAALVASKDDDYLRSLALVGVISALEAFLHDTFAGRVLDNEALLKRYIEIQLSDRKLNLHEVFDRYRGIRNEIKRHLTEMVWHRIEKVTKLYERTLQIKIPDGVDALDAAVKKRHDIAHRGGVTPDGRPSMVSKAELTTLIETVEKFAIALNAEVHPPPPPDPPFEPLGDVSDSPF